MIHFYVRIIVAKIHFYVRMTKFYKDFLKFKARKIFMPIPCKHVVISPVSPQRKQFLYLYTSIVQKLYLILQ